MNLRYSQLIIGFLFIYFFAKQFYFSVDIYVTGEMIKRLIAINIKIKKNIFL